MSGAKGAVKSKAGLSSLVRPKFGAGMLLQHEDLEQLNTYTRELSRLLFRSFFGCGVVCGLVVEVNDDCDGLVFTVGCGLGLDCSGDPVFVPGSVEVVVDLKCDTTIGDTLWVELCGSAKCCSPRTSMCGCDDDEPVSRCTRERDGYEIRVLRDKPDCACGCLDNPDKYPRLDDPCWCANPELPCQVDHYHGKCKCHCENTSDCSCGCDCIVLARLVKKDNKWKSDHTVRRFIRPVLMRDPRVAEELKASAAPDGNDTVLAAMKVGRKLDTTVKPKPTKAQPPPMDKPE